MNKVMATCRMIIITHNKNINIYACPANLCYIYNNLTEKYNLGGLVLKQIPKYVSLSDLKNETETHKMTVTQQMEDLSIH